MYTCAVYIYIWVCLFCLAVASYPLNKPRYFFYILPYGLRIIPLLLPIDCLSIALDAHMLSHNGYGRPGPAAFGYWSLVPGPFPLWLNICASRASDRQSMGNSKGMILSP